ncbi:MAG: lytic transglycosylase domain-containing protein [bacterium JZ-2024 1]
MWTLILGLLAKLWMDIRAEEKARERVMRFWGLIEDAARATGTPPEIIAAIIQKESRGDPNAVGAGRYYGLGQMSYQTARSLGWNGTPSDLLDPRTNIALVAQYLRFLLQRFGNVEAAVAAYNAGPAAVTKEKIPNRRYVNDVLRYASAYVLVTLAPIPPQRTIA